MSPCIHLQVSQASYLEEYDRKVAQIVSRGGEVPGEVLDNDGTNACAFLSVKIAHEIHRLQEETNGSDELVWKRMCDEAERAINEFPRMVNPYRKLEQFYDVQSAYMLIRRIDSAAVDEYDFSEEIMSADFVFSEEGRNSLVHALSTILSKEKFCIGLYTCEPLIFTIGVTKGSIFVVDTHPVTEDNGGKGKGLIKIFPYVREEATALEGICCWIWKRLVCSGVKNDTQQSPSIMSKVARYSFEFVSPKNSKRLLQLPFKDNNLCLSG